MTDRILIRDLHLRTIIGAHDWEREQPQDVVFQIEIETDLSAPAASDSLDDAVDYRALTKMVIGHVQESRFRLIEGLAASVADLALEHFAAIDAVTIRVDKPGALRFARSVAVELRRTR